MRICAFSDMHGNLKFKVEPCDIVLIAGDIVPLQIQRNMSDSENWFKQTFIPWCNDLPCDKVVFVAGNHDFYLYHHKDSIIDMLKENGDKVVYLDCEVFEHNGKTIFGTPWCKPFGRWAFNESYEEQDSRYDKCIDGMGNIDIILSHDAPYGISDVLLQKECPWADGSHIGNQSLTKLVDAVKPKIVFQGHLHSCEHNKTEHNGTDVYCVSLLDENYKMTYEPLYVELD